MKNFIIFAACFFSLQPLSKANYPIFFQSYLADPSPIVVNGRVYVFCSHDIEGQKWWDMRDFICVSSDDLVNWKDEGVVFDAKRDSQWATLAWAPQVVQKDGRFYFYYTNGMHDMGVATSDHITGPFRDPLNHPLIKWKTYGDPTVLIDDDGKGYIYFNQAMMATLNPDMISTGKPEKIPHSEFPQFMEGPWISKINGKYNLSYSTGSLPGYGFSYAQSVSDRPDGDFKSRGLWFWLGSDNLPNTHGGFFDFAGRHYMVYHNVALSGGQALQRSIAIDRVYYGKDGRILPFTSTRHGMPAVKYLDPYVQTAALTLAACHGIVGENAETGDRVLVSSHEGDWTCVRSIDFGSGATGCQVDIFTAKSGARVELKLDDLASSAVGTFEPEGAPGWNTLMTKLQPIQGIHDLYFRFSGTNGNPVKLRWWRFTGGKNSGAKPPETVMETVVIKAMGNDKYLGHVSAPDNVLASQNVASATLFVLLDNQDGTYSFQSQEDGARLRATADGVGLSKSALGPADKYILRSNPDESWCIQSEATGTFMVLKSLDGKLACDAIDDTSQSWTRGGLRLNPGKPAFFRLEKSIPSP